MRFSEQIATGSLVEVWKGKMKKYPDSNEIHKVAIKKLKGIMNLNRVVSILKKSVMQVQ